ncbi:MAG: CapA family protein [bacterium]|nr:CapA family protein [bacterium]
MVQHRDRKKNNFTPALFFIVLVLLVASSSLLPLKAVTETETKSEDKLTLAGLGDCILARRVSVLKDPAFLKLVELLRRVDCTWGNCEMPLVDPEKVYPEDRNDFVIGCEPWGADELKWMGIDFVGLANNHATDFGVAGMFSTVKNLKRVNIGWAGVGKDLEDAARPRYVDTPAGRVAQVSCAAWFPKGSNASKPHPYLKGRPGLNPLRSDEIVGVKKEHFDIMVRVENEVGELFGAKAPEKTPEKLTIQDTTYVPDDKTTYKAKLNQEDVKRITRAIKIARRNARVVIVSLHQHNGFETTPLPAIQAFTHACIDAGADVVFATGAHRLWGIEIYKKKAIFHCLGNFLFHFGSIGVYPPKNFEYFKLPADTRNALMLDELLLKEMPYFTKDFIYESIVPVITFENGNEITGIKLHPILLGKDKPAYELGTPVLAHPAKAKSIIENLTELSKKYNTKIQYKKGVGEITLK